MSERDFELGGRKFKLSKLDVFKQGHILKRVTPILSDVLPMLKDANKLRALDSLSESQKFEEFSKILAPLISGFSKLSDADYDFVLLGLLSAVEVQQAAGNWAKISSSSMLMIQDFELPSLYQIAGRAFVYNLAGFFSGLPQK